MKVKSKTLFIVSFALIIIAIFIVFSISKPQKADFITLKRQDFKYTILANCTVDYPKPLDIKSTSESLVKAIYKKEGEKVKKGEIIILLDDSEEIRRLKIASNNIISLNKKIKNIKNVELPNLYEKEKELKLDLELAKNDLSRAKDLYEAGGISKSDLEKIQKNYGIKLSQYNQLKNTLDNYESSGVLAELNIQIENAKIEYEDYKKKVEEKRIISPFNGKILNINVQKGEKTSLQKVLATVIEDTNWLLVMNVDQRELGLLMNGLKANVKFDAYPEEIFSAYVTYVCTQIDKEKGTCEVRLEIKDQKANKIKYGMSGYAEIYAKSFSNVLIIPQRFVKQSKQKNYVVLYKNNRAYITNINLTRIGENVFLTEDLKEGDILLDIDIKQSGKKVSLSKEVKN